LFPNEPARRPLGSQVLIFRSWPCAYMPLPRAASAVRGDDRIERQLTAYPLLVGAGRAPAGPPHGHLVATDPRFMRAMSVLNFEASHTGGHLCLMSWTCAQRSARGVPNSSSIWRQTDSRRIRRRALVDAAAPEGL
jgi:hypothetical protein